MKNTPLCFFTLLFICSSLTYAQTEIAPPLTRIFHGKSIPTCGRTMPTALDLNFDLGGMRHTATASKLFFRLVSMGLARRLTTTYHEIFGLTRIFHVKSIPTCGRTMPTELDLNLDSDSMDTYSHRPSSAPALSHQPSQLPHSESNEISELMILRNNELSHDQHTKQQDTQAIAGIFHSSRNEEGSTMDEPRQVQDCDDISMISYHPKSNLSRTQHPSAFPTSIVERDEIYELEERGRKLSSLPPSPQGPSEHVESTNVADEASIRKFKNQQVAFITNKIKALKNSYPGETDLIILLESYLQQYEQILDAHTFDQWRADRLTRQQQKIAFNEEHNSEHYNLEVQESYLNVVMSEQEILTSLLSNPVQIETARAFYQIRSMNIQSKEAFEKAKFYFEQYNRCSIALNEYNTAESNRIQSKKAYYNSKKETEFHNWNPSRYNPLYIPAMEKKKFFEDYQKEFNLTYGSLEVARHLKQQHQSVSRALAESGFYFKTIAMTLARILHHSHHEKGAKADRAEQIQDYDEGCINPYRRRSNPNLTQHPSALPTPAVEGDEISGLSQEETSYYRNCVTTLQLLAHDHLSLASAMIEENRASSDHIKKLISVTLKAKSAFDHHFEYWNRIAGLARIFHHSRDEEAAKADGTRQAPNLDDGFMYPYCPSLSSSLTQYPSVFPASAVERDEISGLNLTTFHNSAFFLFEEAGHSFLSAYHSLKDHDPLTPTQNFSEELQSRGIHLINVAHIFEIPPIPAEQRALYHPDLPPIIETARYHAGQVVQLTPHSPERLYHKKIASFLYNRITAINELFEVSNLKATFSNTSPAFFFLEETATLLKKSSSYFARLSELSSFQLNSKRVQLLIEAALESKAKANKMLLKTKALIRPHSKGTSTSQNQNLLS